LRGFCIFNIVVGHLAVHALHSNKSIYIFPTVGSFMVPIFLFLSGYGLTESARLNGIKNFFYKKIVRIYIPFLLLNIIWILLNSILLNYKYSIKSILLSIIGLNLVDRNYWYILYLLFWYLIFYFTINLKIKKSYNILILFIISTILFCILKNKQLFRDNSFNFTLGVFLSFYKDKIFNQLFTLRKKIKIKSINLMFSFLILLIILIKLNAKTNYIFSNSINMFFAIIAIIIFIKLTNCNKFSIFYYFLGNISFEIYLLHGAFMYSYDFILFRLPLFVSFFIYLAMIIFISVLLNKFHKYINYKTNIFMMKINLVTIRN
jgi:peptidoglycan/LPS O-acetylase OafA/YrhL